jgi:RimJ/RimL family protein N-acetyltransferase
VLRTTRLLLRPLAPADLDALHAITGDAERMRFMGDGKPLSRERTGEWIERSTAAFAARGYGTWAVVDEASARLVGFAGLVLTSRGETEIIWGLGREHEGRGLATEASRALLSHAASLGVDRVVATFDPRNARSLRIADRLGMTLQDERLDEHGLPELVYAAPRST